MQIQKIDKLTSIEIWNLEKKFMEQLESVLLNKSESYKQNLMNVWGYWKDYCLLNDISPLELSPINVKRYINSLDVNVRSKKSYLSRVRRLLTILISACEGQVPIVDHWARLKTDKDGMYSSGEIIGHREDELPTRAFLEEHQIVSVLKTLSQDRTDFGHRNRVIFCLLFLCAMRLNELSKLTWAEIKFDERVINPIHAKNGSKMPVRLNQTTINILKEYQKHVEQQIGYIPKYVLLATTPRHTFNKRHIGTNKPINGKTINRMVYKWGDLTGVEGLSSHSGRYTVATKLHHSGVAIKNIQQALRHKNFRVTMERYIQPLRAQEAIEASIDGMFTNTD